VHNVLRMRDMSRYAFPAFYTISVQNTQKSGFPKLPILVKINGYRVITIIDLGVINNFISRIII